MVELIPKNSAIASMKPTGKSRRSQDRIDEEGEDQPLLAFHDRAEDALRDVFLLEDRQEEREARLDALEEAGVDEEGADDRRSDGRAYLPQLHPDASAKPTAANLLAL